MMIEPVTGSRAVKTSRRERSRRVYSQSGLLRHYIFFVLPRVKRRLRFWQEKAGHIPDAELRSQALASLQLKAFHCQGGAVLAIGRPEHEMNLLRVFIAYQTLCDYLDNLCDRAGETNGSAFLQLHQCLLAALDDRRPLLDYYELFPHKDGDGGYMLALVEECRRGIAKLPSFPLVKADILRLADWYILLQVNKHLSWDIRESSLQSWVDQYLPAYPELSWNEWAAASGSTLALFALLNLASQPNLQPDQVRDTLDAYFPWICALHILLDYYIDQEEDRQGGDLNFLFYYQSPEEMDQQFKAIISEARHRADHLSTAVLDLTVVKGLLAMYLSDAKVAQQGFGRQARAFIQACGGDTYRVYWLCRLVRKFL